MGEVITVGLDLAKQVFQAHGADAAGDVVFRKGHETRLIPPAYVKPFVKRQKNDAADAEAICEAAQRPTMRFVAPKSAEAQAAGVLFRTRDLLVRQRTQLINALRGHLAEFGHIAHRGAGHVTKLIELVRDPEADLPDGARSVLIVAADTLEILHTKIRVLGPSDRGPGQGKPSGSTPDDHPWRRTDPGHGGGGSNAGAEHLPARTGFCGLGRPHATPALQRRQGAAPADHQDGRALLTTAADPRRQFGGQRRRSARRARSVACAHAGPQAEDAGHGRAGQQDSKDRLGRHGPWQILQSSDRSGGLNRHPV
jgi:hypothetical protein